MFEKSQETSIPPLRLRNEDASMIEWAPGPHATSRTLSDLCMLAMTAHVIKPYMVYVSIS